MVKKQVLGKGIHALIAEYGEEVTAFVSLKPEAGKVEGLRPVN